jgi:toxin ParE1/3/4
MRIRWSPEAAEDLERIARWIQQNNPSAAEDTAKTIYEGITQLQTFANRGREARIESTRELVFPFLLILRSIGNGTRTLRSFVFVMLRRTGRN